MISRPVSYLVYFFLSTVCSTASADAKGYKNSLLEPYVGFFVAEAHARGVKINPKDISSLSVHFVDKVEDGKSVGMCYWKKNGASLKIVIESKYWFQLSDSDKEALMFHELGHCLLDRDHCEVEMDGKPGKKISIMAAEMEIKPYKYGRKKMIDELFKRDSRCPKDL